MTETIPNMNTFSRPRAEVPRLSAALTKRLACAVLGVGQRGVFATVCAADMLVAAEGASDVQ